MPNKTENDLDASFLKVHKELTEAVYKTNDETAKALYLCTAAVLPCLMGIAKTLMAMAEKTDA